MKKIRLVMKVIAMVLLGFTLFTSRLLPLNIMIAIGAIEVLLLVLAWKRKVLQVFVVVLMLITSSGLMYVEFVAERIINYDPNQVNTISFFVVKDSRTTSIKTAIKNESDFAVSTLLDDKVVTFVEEKLAEKEYVEDLVSYEGIADGISGLLDGTFDVLVVDQGYLSTVLEYDPTFLEETKVIWSIEKTDEITNLTEANVTKEPFVVYIAGVDNRDEFQANRHDVNILVVVDPIKREMTMVSIPRDAYVQLGCKTRTAMDKLTHAGVYGMECAIKTMQLLLDVDVNYYAQVNFNTVTQLAEVIKPIPVYSELAFSYQGCSFQKGLNQLNPVCTPVFARERSAFTTGAQHRIRHPPEVIQGIIKRLLQPAMLTKIESIIQSVEGTVKTNMSGNDIFALVRAQIQKNTDWSFKQYALTGKDAYLPSYAMGGRELYMVQLDKTKLAEAQAAIQAALQPVASE